MGTWVKDEDTDNCAGCNKQISGGVFKSGKHHCRRCGRVFCGECTSKRMELPEIEVGVEYRVCDGCFEHSNRKAQFEKDHLLILLAGQVFLKHNIGFSMKDSRRVVKLSDDRQCIIWHHIENKGDEQLPLYAVREVIKGHKTAVFERTGKKDREHLAFSVVADERTLDLEADTEVIRDLWVEALKQALELLHIRTPEQARSADEAARERERVEEEKKAQALSKHSNERQRLRELRMKAGGGGGDNNKNSGKRAGSLFTTSSSKSPSTRARGGGSLFSR